MAIDTYANLKSTIATYLNRDDLTANIPDFIALTEKRLNRELRVREMINSDTSITTVSGTQSYSLPTGFIEAITVIFQSDPFVTLPFTSNHDFYKKYNSSVASGSPSFFTIVGDKIKLGVAPDQAVTLQIDFYKEITTLSDSVTTNDILTTFPELYLYGSLAESSPFLMQDERLNVWASLYKEAVNKANESAMKGSSSTPLMMSARMVV
tara:strand:- start:182 stop:808 length:627 start_codon:yes stop_codon:yes gene_type:complete